MGRWRWFLKIIFSNQFLRLNVSCFFNRLELLIVYQLIFNKFSTVRRVAALMTTVECFYFDVSDSVCSKQIQICNSLIIFMSKEGVRWQK